MNGRISAAQWYDRRSAVFNALASSVDQLGRSAAYADVAKTLEQREQRLVERGVTSITYSPDEELMYLYYSIQPVMKLDPETGTMRLDFDTYYAQIDALIDALDEPYRQTFIDRLQYSWNPMERLHWDVSREYFSAYKKIRNLYLDKYTPEEQATIQRIEVADLPEREMLMETVDPRTGNKLYSQFSSEVSDARVALRKLSPDLDAWLAFFGRTTKFYSTTATNRYNEFREQFLTSDMIE